MEQALQTEDRCDTAEAGTRQLKHWTIYRSGAALSVSGIDAITLRTVTLTQIGVVEPSQGKIIVNGMGADWELVL